MKGSLFNRDQKIFSWVIQNPWISTQKGDPIPYHFSYFANQFKNIFLKFSAGNGIGSAYLWLVVNDRKLSVPYFYTNDESLYLCMAHKIVQTMISSACAYTTIRDPLLLKHMRSFRKWFMGTKKMPQFIFAHKELSGRIPTGRKFYDGDGDVVFAG